MSFLAELWAHELYWNSDVRSCYSSESDWREAERRAFRRLSAHFGC